MTKRTCSIEGCGNPVVGRDLCRKHYSRLWRWGTTADPEPVAPSACSISGCGQPVKAKGWCQKHYRRWERHGSPEVLKRVRRGGSIEERFWSRVDKNGSGGCWVWTGIFYWTGYGQFPAEGGRALTAHRWGYQRFVGPVPEGLELDHLCRNRACVRFDHLEPVTHAENMRRSPRSKWTGLSCAVVDCDQAAKVHGLCQKHYMRQRRSIQ